MSEISVKVFLATEADTANTKTTVINVKAIQRIDEDDIFLFPPAVQTIQEHDKLAELSPIKKIKSLLVKRHQTRTVRITLDEEVAKLYVDKHGNFCYKGEYLEGGQVKYVREDNPKRDDSDNTVEVKKRSLHNIQKELVIEKFDGKNYNAMTWLKLFEEECRRIEVEIDQYPDVLRLVLEGYPSNWYQATKKTLGNSPWTLWRKEYRLAFGTKGWSEIAEAINFKYIGGSIIEYVFKKHNLLLDSDPDLSEKSRIGLIVIGLPSYAQSRLNRVEIDTIGALTSSLNQLESVRQEPRKVWDKKNSFGRGASFSRNCSSNSNSNNSNNSYNRNKKYEPCSFCKKNGREGMYHPERVCWLNPNGENYRKPEEMRRTGPVKIANNTLFERQLNEEENVKN